MDLQKVDKIIHEITKNLIHKHVISIILMNGCEQVSKQEAEASIIATPDTTLIALVYSLGLEKAHDRYNGQC